MIHRTEERQTFTVINGETIKDEKLSIEALGLLVRMLSMSEKWNFSIEGLMCAFGIPHSTAVRCLKELKALGYVKTIRTKNAAGKFTSCEWHVYETRHVTENHNTVSHNTENHNTENRIMENHNTANHNTEIPNDITNINITNINKTNIKVTKNKHGEFENVQLTEDEFQKLADKLGTELRDRLIEELSCYLTNHPKKYKNHYATVLSWARKRETDHKQRSKPATTENPFTLLRKAEGYE